MSGQYNNGQKTSFVAGAGIVSLPFVEELVRAVKGPRPLTRLVWITGGKMPGLSEPFEGQIGDAVKPLLNQAAFAMGISKHDVDGYANWLKENTRIKDARYAFTDRPLFGNHSRSFARKLLDDAHKGASLTIEIKHETVTSVLPDHAGKFYVTYASGGGFKADSGAIAVGPTRSNRLDHLLGQDSYIPYPNDVTAFNTIAKKSDRTSFVTIYGSGSSMVDALRQLEAVHYPGQYHIVGRGLNFWASEPWKEDPQNPNTVKNYALDKAQTQSLVDRLAQGRPVHATLQAFYQHELRRKPKLGFHNVLAAFPREEIAQRLRADHREEAAVQVEKYQDHVCCPDTIALLAKLKKQGRLIIDKGNVEEIAATDGGFDLRMADGRISHAETLINAVPFSRGAGPAHDRHPLFARLIDSGHMHADRNNIIETNANGEAMPGLFVLGAASHKGAHWGVESFREMAHAAGLAAAQALRGPEPPRQRDEAKPVLPLPRIYPQQSQRGSAHVY